MKTFVDNVTRQVIERHIIRNLQDVFSPPTVLGFSDFDIERISAETSDKQEQRRELSALEQCLQDSLRGLDR